MDYHLDLSDSRIEPASLASPALAGGFFTGEPPGKPTHGVLASITMETSEKVFYTPIKIMEKDYTT